MSNFLAFLGVSFIVIATPGPDTAITIRNTVRNPSNDTLRSPDGLSPAASATALSSRSTGTASGSSQRATASAPRPARTR